MNQEHGIWNDLAKLSAAQVEDQIHLSLKGATTSDAVPWETCHYGLLQDQRLREQAQAWWLAPACTVSLAGGQFGCAAMQHDTVNFLQLITQLSFPIAFDKVARRVLLQWLMSWASSLDLNDLFTPAGQLGRMSADTSSAYTGSISLPYVCRNSDSICM